MTEEFNDIIRIYKYIANISNRKYDVVKIYFALGQQKLMMMFDPNDQDICNYKRIQQLCKEHDIPFRNQSFNQVVDALKTRKFDTSTKRHVFSKEERKTIL